MVCHSDGAIATEESTVGTELCSVPTEFRITDDSMSITLP